MFKQVIVVEGKTDTQKLQSIFGKEIKTIETKGLAINEKTLNFIKNINEQDGIIIFTDPDGPGKKIREKIIEHLGSKVLNAFITKKDINKLSKKIGIAEADEQAIKDALNNLLTFESNTIETITWKEYLDNDFYLKSNRIILAKHFGWDEKISSKTLFKWLNWNRLNVSKIKEILEVKNGN